MALFDRSPPPRPKVLIVDDDPHVLRVLHAILEELADIFFAKNGEEALLQIERRQPDLVLLDADMPGLGGYATCAVLKANSETVDLPVVFVTSYTDSDSETKALAMGAADFIHKPVNPPVVRARVKTQLALKHKSDELRRLTNVDGLTGIANRRAFDEALSTEWRRTMRTREPLSLLMLDVDHFKLYNDTYGHPAGDGCLRRVAEALADCAKRAGDAVARYGGEEFAVILPHTRPVDAQAFAERVCAQVRNLAIPHQASLTESVVTLSIGAASLYTPCSGNSDIPGPCSDCHLKTSCCQGPGSLVVLADQALYLAKRQGRNRVVCLTGTPDPALVEDDRGEAAGGAFPE